MAEEERKGKGPSAAGKGRGQKMNHDVIREQKRAGGYSVAIFHSEGRKKGRLGRKKLGG